MRLIVAPGQRNDITQAEALLEGFEADYVLADKGYDGKTAVDAVKKAGAIPVISSRKYSKQPRHIDAQLYKERNIIERFFGYLKQFRRVATRYDKHIQNYLGFVKIAAIAVWIK